MRILFALLSIAVGLALVLSGYRLARFIIPLWGFITGLALGGAIASTMSDTPFLGAAIGLVVGIFLGLIFGLLSYLYYAVAVLVLFGALGYWLGSSFILLLGFDHGFLSVMAGMALGIVAGLIALALNAPKFVLIVVTAVAGAVTTVGGVLLLFNQVTLEAFSYASVNATIRNSVWWMLVAVALAIAGMTAQSRAASQYYLDEWTGGAGGSTSHDVPPTDHKPGGY